MFSDESGRKKVILVAVPVLIILVAVFAWSLFRGGSNSVDVPEGTFWICKKCDNHFNMSTRALNDFQAKHYGEPLPCPKCGSTELIHAVRCPKCGEYVPKTGGPPTTCPKCGYDFSKRPTEG